MSIFPAVRPAVSPAVRGAFEQGSGGGAASIIAGLFAQGQQGFWLPFTDFASLSQDAAGTLPYTALEQPVGRVLDRSQGLRLGAQIANDPDMTSLTGLPNNGGLASPFEIVPWEGAATTLHVVGPAFSGTILPGAFVGKTYFATVRVWVVSGGCYFGNYTSRIGNTTLVPTGGWQTLSGYTSPSSNGFACYSDRAGSEWYLDSVNFYEVLGNHASQVTSTARGVVSARVNLLDNSEFAGNSGVSTGTNYSYSTLSGYLGAVRFALHPSGGYAYKSGSPAVGLICVFSVVVKMDDESAPRTASQTATDDFRLVVNGNSYPAVSTVALGGGLYRLTSAPMLITASNTGIIKYATNSAKSFTATAYSLVPVAQAALPYQRVNTATDYDAVGFPKCLRLDGTDDNYTCGGGGSTTGFYYSDVIRPNGAGNRTLFYNSVFGLKSGVLISLVSNKFNVSIGNGSAYVPLLSAETLTSGELVHVAAWDDLTNVYLQINGGTIQSMARPAMPAGPPTINLYNTGAFEHYNGSITEPIYRAGPPPSAYEREVIRNYQMQKAGML